MTAPGNDLLFLVLTLSILLSSAYAVGRIHEWHRHGVERDEAYRRGYDKASLSIITMMNSQDHGRGGPRAVATSVVTVPSARRSGRHARGRQFSADHPRSRPPRRLERDRTGA